MFITLGGNMKKDYATALVELRSKLNISQRQLSEYLLVSFQSINRWENNKTTPVKIARIRIEKMCKDNSIIIDEVNIK